MWGDHRGLGECRAPKSVQIPEEAEAVPTGPRAYLAGRTVPDAHHEGVTGAAQATARLPRSSVTPRCKHRGCWWGSFRPGGDGGGQGHSPGAGGVEAAGTRVVSLSRGTGPSRPATQPCSDPRVSANTRFQAPARPGWEMGPVRDPLSMFRCQDRQHQGHLQVLALCAPGRGDAATVARQAGV